MSSIPSRPLWQGRALALLGIVLFAFSLRSAVASLSPVVALITGDFPMPPAIIGLIGTAPPVCYAVFGILTPQVRVLVSPVTLVHTLCRFTAAHWIWTWPRA